MISVGYMAKHVALKPDWLKAPNVVDIFSVSDCCSDGFLTDKLDHIYSIDAKHNGWYFFDSPKIIQAVASENSSNLEGTKLFYYEVYEFESAESGWRTFLPEPSQPVSVLLPTDKKLEGFDVVTYSTGRLPECSPLSCNSLSENISVTSHCLLSSFEEAERSLNTGKFIKCEAGPYRIFAVYSVEWPGASS